VRVHVDDEDRRVGARRRLLLLLLLLHRQAGGHHGEGLTGARLSAVRDHGHRVALRATGDQRERLARLVSDQSHRLPALRLRNNGHGLLAVGFLRRGQEGHGLAALRDQGPAVALDGDHEGGRLVLRAVLSRRLAGHHRVHVAPLVHRQLLLLHLLVHRLADLQHLRHQQVASQVGDVRHDAEVEGERGRVGEVEQRQEADFGETCGESTTASWVEAAPFSKNSSLKYSLHAASTALWARCSSPS
uniref:Uncharacterized protein n=1 Tax=Gasterosteus aculeatus TaxID=69293 RepID=G3PK98_GASAC